MAAVTATGRAEPHGGSSGIHYPVCELFNDGGGPCPHEESQQRAVYAHVWTDKLWAFSNYGLRSIKTVSFI